MPRKARQPHPSVRAADNNFTGFPEHGDEWSEEIDPADDDEQEGEDNTPAKPDRLAQLEEENRRLRGDVDNLRRAIPPAQPRQETPPQEEEVDWETILFENPKAALEKHAELVEKRVTNKLERKYQTDQGTKRFWEDFYKVNSDLVNDRDLVELTLNSNLNKLANMPVPDALKELGDLTRERIMRYSRKSTGRKARAEGNEPPQSRRQAPQEEPEKPSTLGDLLKARREARRRKQQAA